MKRNKLLIPIFMGMSYRNFILSGIINQLSEDYNITLLLMKDSKLEILINQSGFKYISLEIGIFEKIIRRSTNFIEKLQYLNFYEKHNTATMEKYIKKEKENRLYFIQNTASKIIGRFFDAYSYFSWHYSFILSKKIKKQLLDFDNVFLLSTDYILDKAILKYCSENKINTNVIVHSWDNLPARGFLSSKPDKILVWNNVMKIQAKELHNMFDEDIEVVGIPQFEYYKSKENLISKEKFRTFYNINGSKKIVTYTCSAYRVFPDEPLFVKKLIEIIDKIGCYLILRLHPTERFEYYNNTYLEKNNVIIDKPNGTFAATITDDINKNNENEILKFISLMKYSDVVINLASTITLDAIIFGTPVICPSFNIDSSIKGKWNEASNWYTSTHYKDIINFNAVIVSKNLKDLENDILKYLDNRDYLKEFRKKLASDFCLINTNSTEKIVKSFK